MNKKIMILVSLFCITGGIVFSQTFGPYTEDANTVLLMHFDGDLTNPGAAGDGVGTGTITYVTNDGPTGLDQAAYLNNSALEINDTTIVPFDTSYISLADEAGLDLTGDWTIEGWIKTASFNDWSDDVDLIAKPDTFSVTEHWWRSGRVYNYSVKATGGNDGFGTKWRDQDLRRPYGLPIDQYNIAFDDKTARAFLPLEGVNPVTDSVNVTYDWVHFTMWRDAVNRFEALAIHAVDGTLLGFDWQRLSLGNTQAVDEYWWEFHPSGVGVAHTTDEPLYIGYNIDNSETFDGYIDEFRVSDVVRSVEGMPAVVGYDRLWNQDDDLTAYTVAADIMVLGQASGITSASLNYHTRTFPIDDKTPIDDGGWESVAMVNTSGITWSADIPAQAFGSLVEYYISYETADGYSGAYGTKWDCGDDANAGLCAPTDSTYLSFVIWKDNSTTLDITFEPEADQEDGTPGDASEYGNVVEALGDYILSDDVPDPAKAGPSTTSYYLPTGYASYLQVKDSDFQGNKAFTISCWFKADAFIEDAHLMVKLSGSRWAGESYTWWRNAFDLQLKDYGEGDFGIVHYTALKGNWHYHWCYQLSNDETGWYSHGLAANTWYQALYGLDYTGDATVDSAYAMVKDETGAAIVAAVEPLHVPSPQYYGHFRAARRPTFGVSMEGKIDHIKVYNYFKADEFVPIVGIADQGAAIPDKFALSQNYPNPFNPITTIDFAISKSQNIEVVIYSVLGQRVKTLLSRSLPSGEYSLEWDGTDAFGKEVASGLYFCKLIGENNSQIRKMTLLR